MAPRMTNAELIAAEEAKLADIRAKAEEKVQAQIAKTQARLAELNAKAEEKQANRIEKLDELIAGAKERVTKAQAYLDKLTLERDELTAEPEQPELPAEDEAPVDIKSTKRAKSDAA